MAKRGSARPWRVRYHWTNGVTGVDTYHDQEEAEMKAEQIRQAAARRADVDVTVTVERRPE